MPLMDMRIKKNSLMAKNTPMEYNFDLFQKILIYTEDQRFRHNYSEIFLHIIFL